MSYTSYDEIATCDIDFANEDELLDSIIFYLRGNRQEIKDGFLKNVWDGFYDDEMSEDEAFDELKCILNQYICILSNGKLEITCDSESDTNYDSEVFSFLVNHICLLQTSDFMEVISHSEDSRDGHSQSVSYYDSTGTYLTADELKTQNKSNVMEQIQEDILSYASSIDDEGIFFTQEVLDNLCQIVVDNFKKL